MVAGFLALGAHRPTLVTVQLRVGQRSIASCRSSRAALGLSSVRCGGPASPAAWSPASGNSVAISPFKSLVHVLTFDAIANVAALANLAQRSTSLRDLISGAGNSAATIRRTQSGDRPCA
jgi:hypothetical protein